MVYKTVIEIIADAEDKNEAMDIAGEFLRGNLDNGVKMKCHAKPLRPYRFVKIGTLSFLSLFVVIIGIASFVHFRDTHLPLSEIAKFSAIQPPLKTNQTAEFKGAWQEEENKRVLEYIEK